MKDKIIRRRWIVFRVIGVLIVLLLIAAAAFAAYRLGWQKGLASSSDADLADGEVWGAPWQVMPGGRFYMLPFGGLFGLLMGFFLVLMAVRFIIGPRYVIGMPHRSHFHPHWRRFHHDAGEMPWDQAPPESERGQEPAPDDSSD